MQSCIISARSSSEISGSIMQLISYIVWPMKRYISSTVIFTPFVSG